MRKATEEERTRGEKGKTQWTCKRNRKKRDKGRAKRQEKEGIEVTQKKNLPPVRIAIGANKTGIRKKEAKGRMRNGVKIEKA